MFLRQSLVKVLRESGRKFWRWELQHHRILPARRLLSRTTPTRRSSPGESPRPTTAAGDTEPAATKIRLWHNAHPLMVSKVSNFAGYSISEICGNVSFVFVCIAYLNTDILRLRLLSTGSIALSILFQYYRAIPLWIPIRWNALLLAINTVMTASLIAERRRADNMPKDLEEMYQNGLFETRGFSKVEFVRLFGKASKLTFKKGEKLARDGQSNRRLYFVVLGDIEIDQKGKKLAMVTRNHFIGEMTFLNFLVASEESEASDSGKIAGTMATADAVVESNEVVAYVWDFVSLRDYLKGEREVRNALSAYMNHDLREKLASLNASTANQ